MASLPKLEHKPEHNHLLGAMPTEILERMAGDLRLTPLILGAMVYEPGEQLQFAYFPTTAIVSMHYVTASGATVETASVGREGMVGVSLFMGGNSMPSSAVVVTAGHAYRFEAHLLRQKFDSDAVLRSLLLRYTQDLMTQMSQNAVCNRHHSIAEQLCRWLLQNVDRSPSRQLVMTQELIANILGVRRESVTEEAVRLQLVGCISYRRGHIEVLDRVGLERRACECYGVLKKERARLLPAKNRKVTEYALA
jgi:CRP-like cAMP-binding protein